MSDPNPGEEKRPDDEPLSPPQQKRLPGAEKTQPSPGQRKSRPKPPAAPDTEACLSALGILPGLIATGVLKTSQANSMKGIYGTILQQHHRTRTARDQGQLEDSDVMEILRSNPSLLSMLAPLLTEEQIDALMADVKDDDDGQT